MTTTGAKTIAETLKKLGVKTVFGIVGIPIVEIAESCISNGIKFISFRNEQQASYAASLYGYMTNRPGVLLVVGGPGIINALSGIHNSNSNKWPLLVLAGSSGIHEINKAGGFQELDQVSLLKNGRFAKFAAQPDSVSSVSALITKAYLICNSGRPGTSYVDFRADIIQQEVDINDVSLRGIDEFDESSYMLVSQPDPRKLKNVIDVLKSAKSPLLIVGKGAANSYQEVREFVDIHKIPFLPTPMGKGIVPDSHSLNVSSGRSLALKNADVIILAGARLNWMLHFGEPPKFNKDVQLIQIDSDAEELAADPRCLKYGLNGDVGTTLKSISTLLDSKLVFPPISSSILASIEKNDTKRKQSETISSSSSSPLTHAQCLAVIRESMTAKYQHDAIFVSEGARTMDSSRLTFALSSPKQRIDAGTNGTMGIGIPYALTAKLTNPDKLVVCIQGDSAFGFSAMEVETLVRCRLPVLIVVLNNSGIYKGVAEPEQYVANGGDKVMPSTALSSKTRYDILAISLGAKGYFVENGNELSDVMEKALVDVLDHERVCLVNVIIDNSGTEVLSFGWMNSKPKL